MTTIASFVVEILGKTDALEASVKRSTDLVSGFVESAKKVGEMATGFALAQVGLEGVAAAMNEVKDAAIGLNAQLETSSLQFEMFSKNADWAKQHVADLFQFAKNTPFMTQPIIDASRQLEVFGGTALNTMSNIRLIGDTAARSGVNIDQMTFWFTRMYASLRSGEPIGMATMELQRMGAMSGDTANKMRAMEQAGATNIEIWEVFKEGLSSSTGSMERMAGTWAGVTTTFEDTKRIIIAEVFQPMFEAARDTLGKINAFLGSSQVEAWARSMQENVGAVISVLGTLASAVGQTVSAMSSLLGMGSFGASGDAAKNADTAKSLTDVAAATEEASDGMSALREVNKGLVGFDMPHYFESVTTSARSMIATFGDIGSSSNALLTAANNADVLQSSMSGALADVRQRAENAKIGNMTDVLNYQQPGLGDQVAAQYQQTRDAATQLEAAMVPMQQRLEVAENGLKAMKLAMEPLSMTIREQELAIKTYTQEAIVPLQTEVDHATNAVNDFKLEEVDASHAVTEAQNAVEALEYQYIDVTRGLKGATEALREEKVAHRDVEYALQDATEALRQHRVANIDVQHAAEDAKDALQAAQDALQPWKESVENTSNALDRMKTATENVRIATQPLKDTMDDAAQRVGRVRDMLSDAKEKLDRFLQAPVQGDAAFRAATAAHEDRLRNLQMRASQMQAMTAMNPAAANNPAIQILDRQIQRENDLWQVQTLRHEATRAPLTRGLAEIEAGEKGPERSQQDILGGAAAAASPIWGLTQVSRDMTDSLVSAKNAWHTMGEDSLLVAQRAERSAQMAADMAKNMETIHNLDLLPQQQTSERADIAQNAANRSLRPDERLVEYWQNTLDSITNGTEKSLQRVVDMWQDMSNNVTNNSIRKLTDGVEDQQEKLRQVHEKMEPYQYDLDIAAAKLTIAQEPLKDMNRELAANQTIMDGMQLQYDQVSLSVDHLRDRYTALGKEHDAVMERIKNTSQIVQTYEIANPVQPDPVSHERDQWNPVKANPGWLLKQGSDAALNENWKQMSDGEKSANDLADGINHINEALKNNGMAQFAADVLLVVVAFNVLSPIVGTVLGIIGTIGGVIAPAIEVVGELSIAFGGMGLSEAIGVAGAALTGFIATLFGPLTLAIAAVALVVAGFALAWANDWGGIQEKTSAVWSGLSDVFGKVASALINLEEEVLPPIINLFKTWWGFLSDHVLPILIDLANIGIVLVSKELSGLYNDVWVPLIEPMFSGWLDILGKVIGLLKDGLVGALNAVGGWFQSDGWKNFKDFIGMLTDDMVSKLDALHTLLSAFGGQSGPIPNRSPYPETIPGTPEYQRAQLVTPHARGGDASGWAMVGEEGPEIVRLPYGSHVYPNGVIPHFREGGDLTSLGSNATQSAPTYDQITAQAAQQWTDSYIGRAESQSTRQVIDQALQFQQAANSILTQTATVVSDAAAFVEHAPYMYGQSAFIHNATADELSSPSYMMQSYMGSGSQYTGPGMTTSYGSLLQTKDGKTPYYNYMGGFGKTPQGGDEFSGFNGMGEAAPDFIRGMPTNKYGAPVVNTTVNVGVNVGNNKELASIVTTEQSKSLQQAKAAG